MTSTPPPPPPPAPSGSGIPWYKSGSTPLLLGLLVAGVIGGGAYLLFSGGDDDGVAVSTSTTAGGGVTTSAAVTTSTAAASTTTVAAPTTSAAATTTTLAAPTTTIVPPPTTTTTAPPQLDFTLPATFASEDLAHLFLPDPWTQPVLAGGIVDVSYLETSGGACFGYAAEAPDVQITWSGGGTLLRIYFIADTIGDDTVLIINDPSGGWWCGDDSFGTSNPTVDFTSPVNGVYDIWVGTYASLPFMNGDIFVTEFEGNHP